MSIHEGQFKAARFGAGHAAMFFGEETRALLTSLIRGRAASPPNGGQEGSPVPES
jgi:hypothetical protein